MKTPYYSYTTKTSNHCSKSIFDRFDVNWFLNDEDEFYIEFWNFIIFDIDFDNNLSAIYDKVNDTIISFFWTQLFHPFYWIKSNRIFRQQPTENATIICLTTDMWTIYLHKDNWIIFSQGTTDLSDPVRISTFILWDSIITYDISSWVLKLDNKGIVVDWIEPNIDQEYFPWYTYRWMYPLHNQDVYYDGYEIIAVEFKHSDVNIISDSIYRFYREDFTPISYNGEYYFMRFWDDRWYDIFATYNDYLSLLVNWRRDYSKSLQDKLKMNKTTRKALVSNVE